jgi:hypothetical protein
MLPDIDSRIDGRMMAGTLVTGNFFNALRVSPSLGRALRHGDRWPPEARTLCAMPLWRSFSCGMPGAHLTRRFRAAGLHVRQSPLYAFDRFHAVEQGLVRLGILHDQLRRAVDGQDKRVLDPASCPHQICIEFDSIPRSRRRDQRLHQGDVAV